ncbi:hypothetical protein LO763_08755 [Glycomyces sp. A-F 0318]|uniref:hypothetical protein n=1 Tax=Glycomyces amatae TaxID=2881355 RepID=UPI001E2E1A0B|nr:hypothetical protein [Glycomyces amatae]MCD0443709.1 hypothetical protein [Glycomyces amatae]
MVDHAAADRSVMIRRGGHCFRFIPDLDAAEVRITLLYSARTAPLGLVKSLRDAPAIELEEGCPAELRADALRIARTVFFRADYQQFSFDQAIAGIRARANRTGPA